MSGKISRNVFGVRRTRRHSIEDNKRSPPGKGSVLTGSIAAFTPPKGARALLPAANHDGKGAGPFHPARSWR
jgi:hypothetical protein